MGKIFISYSHKDSKCKNELVKQLKVLQLEGYLEIWEDTKIQAGDQWYDEIKKAINDSDAAVLLISADFLTSDFIRKQEVPDLLKRRTEGEMKIFPLIVKHCPWSEVKWLNPIQARPRDCKPLSDLSKSKRDKALSDFAIEIKNLLNKKGIPEKDESPGLNKQGPNKISLYKLPNTGDRFFGREEELQELDAAWADEHTHIVALIAWGGVGKSALVNQWLNIMECKNYCGAQKVYGWSFYSQGAEEGKQASADEFMQETLKWFGDANPGEGSAVDRGRRLARLVQNEKTLLILDGMEPLQYPPGQVQGFDGQLKDQGLKTFLKELSGGHTGLCIITSREPVTDLSHKKGFAVKERELEHLSTEAGRQLLNSLGVKGTDKKIIKAVEEYKGHALALTLLGRYIKTVYDGDIRKRDTIPQLTGERSKGPHAQRVMAAYERWLGEGPELNVSRIMGLFDRPVEKGTLDALKAKPGIPGVTDKLQELGEEEWQWALDNLRSASLLAKNDQQRPGVLDCHPLVREYFGEKLKRENEEGWKQAHKRLYHYYKDLPKKEYPDTLVEMEPLFAAVAHGCSAGLHQEALDDIYWKRICREKEAFINKKIGAFGSDLAMLSHFFEKPWIQPAPGLKDADKAVVLSWAAFGLRAVGRLYEAIQPMKAGLKMLVENKDWQQAAGAAGNLSELMLTLGNVAEAVTVAHESVTHADRSNEWSQMMTKRTALADALHQAGQLQEAEQWFQEAETTQKKSQPEYPYLYSLPGYRYCNLLLGQGKYNAVMERAEAAIKIAKRNKWLLEISLDHLSLGRAGLMKSLKENSRDFTRALDHFNQAVTGLREANHQEFLSKGLFARAECYRLMTQFSNAWDDLNEAFEIAESGGMRRYICDFHLEAGRLCQAEGKAEEAGEHFRKAKELIKETGYLRREKEIGIRQ